METSSCSCIGLLFYRCRACCGRMCSRSSSSGCIFSPQGIKTSRAGSCWWRPPKKWSGLVGVTDLGGFIYLFTAQGHLRAFHKFKCRTSSIQYQTCTLHNDKTYKHNPKASPLRSCSCDAGTVDCFGLAFQYQITKIMKNEWTKTNDYRLIVIPVPYGSICRTYHQLKYSSPNRSTPEGRLGDF